MLDPDDRRRWDDAVRDVAQLAGHANAPATAWGCSSSMEYNARTDTVHISRSFAAQWKPTSPQARYLIAHELYHRALVEHRARLMARTMLTDGWSLLTLATGTLTAAAVIHSGVGGLFGMIGATSLVVLLTVIAAFPLAVRAGPPALAGRGVPGRRLRHRHRRPDRCQRPGHPQRTHWNHRLVGRTPQQPRPPHPPVPTGQATPTRRLNLSPPDLSRHHPRSPSCTGAGVRAAHREPLRRTVH